MYRRSFTFLLFVTFACVAASAQTPEPKKGGDKAFSGTLWSIDGSDSYLGIQTQEISNDNFAKFGLQNVRGVGIEKVLENSPAAAAGLQNGDVILKFNGEDVTSTRKLTRLMSEVAPDHQARLTVSRGGNERELTVTIGKRPAPVFGNGAFTFNLPDKDWSMPNLPDMPPMVDLPRIQGFPQLKDGDKDVFIFRSGSDRQIGVGVSPLTKQLSEHFGVTGGVMINNVRENSPAAKAGLKAGDIIVEADGQQLTGEMELIKAIGAKKAGSVVLTIVRDKNRQTISVTPEEVKGGVHLFDRDPEDGQAPGRFKLLIPKAPQTPPAPMPLNQFFIPGRIV